MANDVRYESNKERKSCRYPATCSSYAFYDLISVDIYKLTEYPLRSSISADEFNIATASSLNHPGIYEPRAVDREPRTESGAKGVFNMECPAWCLRLTVSDFCGSL